MCIEYPAISLSLWVRLFGRRLAQAGHHYSDGRYKEKPKRHEQPEWTLCRLLDVSLLDETWKVTWKHGHKPVERSTVSFFSPGLSRSPGFCPWGGPCLHLQNGQYERNWPELIQPVWSRRFLPYIFLVSTLIGGMILFDHIYIWPIKCLDGWKPPTNQYPLVNVYIANWTITIFNRKINELNGPCSIVFCKFTRG